MKRNEALEKENSNIFSAMTWETLTTDWIFLQTFETVILKFY